MTIYDQIYPDFVPLFSTKTVYLERKIERICLAFPNKFKLNSEVIQFINGLRDKDIAEKFLEFAEFYSFILKQKPILKKPLLGRHQPVQKLST